MALILLLSILVLLNLAAWRWGFDSTDGFGAAEWERRREWRGFGGGH